MGDDSATALWTRVASLETEHAAALRRIASYEDAVKGGRWQARCYKCGWHTFPTRLKKQANDWAASHECPQWLKPPDSSYGKRPAVVEDVSE